MDTALLVILIILTVIVAIFDLFILLKIIVYAQIGFCKSKARLDGKVVVITGANIGIGYETGKDLARRGAKVILACRSAEKGNAACDEIRQATGSDKVHFKSLDVSSMSSVRKFAAEIIEEEAKLDLLVLNAGMATVNQAKTLTEDGLELNFATNHFGHFLLTNLLLDLMIQTWFARIVIVSSVGHKFVSELDVHNLNGELKWEPRQVYVQTKLANVLFMRELVRRLQLIKVGPAGARPALSMVTVNSLHPGAVRTAIWRHAKENMVLNVLLSLPQLFFKTCWEGAQTTIHLCVAEELNGVTGFYWDNCKKTATSKLAQDSQLARKLWDASASLVKMGPEDTILE